MAKATTTAQIHPDARTFHIGRIFIYFVLIVGAAAAIFPFLYTVSVSLMNLTEATGGRMLPATPNGATIFRLGTTPNFPVIL